MSDDKFIWNRNAALFEINSRRITQEQRERMERDAMAWQASLAVAANPEMAGLGADGVVRAGYALTDAFLAERKRQQGEA